MNKPCMISDAVTIFTKIMTLLFSDPKVDLHCCIRAKKYVIAETDIVGRRERMVKLQEKII